MRIGNNLKKYSKNQETFRCIQWSDNNNDLEICTILGADFNSIDAKRNMTILLDINKLKIKIVIPLGSALVVSEDGICEIVSESEFIDKYQECK
jgi:hypothetical protein